MKSNELPRVAARRWTEQERAHVVDPVAHRAELLEPASEQRLIGKNAGGDRRAVIGRHGVDAAGDLQHVALHCVRAGLALA